MFDNATAMKEKGFNGFRSIAELQATNCEVVPNEIGVYLVVRDDSNPQFLSESIGGHFKGKNPTVPIDDLKNEWLPNAKVVYIGKAGSFGGSATLRSRLRQYMKFGQGKPIGHWGGRYIWQLANSGELTVAWKTTPTLSPRDRERELIAEFVSAYGKRPFANLQG